MKHKKQALACGIVPPRPPDKFKSCAWSIVYLRSKHLIVENTIGPITEYHQLYQLQLSIKGESLVASYNL